MRGSSSTRSLSILAITAPDDDKAAQCVEIAEQIAVNMSEIEVERAKREAETNAREPIQ